MAVTAVSGVNLVYEGLLSKKGSSFPWNWKTRHFILTPTKLTYYEKFHGQKRGQMDFLM